MELRNLKLTEETSMRGRKRVQESRKKSSSGFHVKRDRSCTNTVETAGHAIYEARGCRGRGRGEVQVLLNYSESEVGVGGGGCWLTTPPISVQWLYYYCVTAANSSYSSSSSEKEKAVAGRYT